MMKVKLAPLQQGIEKLLIQQQCAREEAQIVAENLIWNTRIGRDAHGLARLKPLVERLSQGLIVAPCQPTYVRKSPALMHVHGKNGLGQYIGYCAMQKALDLAKEQGLGGVSVSESNWNGTGAYYVQLAAERGMLGLCMSNGFAKVNAFGGSQPVFGTNPVACGVPRKNGESILIDLATSQWSGGRTREALQRGETPPSDALSPLGGIKGSALGLMVEVFSALLTGAGLSKEVGSMFSTEPGKLQGQFFLALNITVLMELDVFCARTDQLLTHIKDAGVAPVFYPGERRWLALQKNGADHVKLPLSTYHALKSLMDTEMLQEAIS